MSISQDNDSDGNPQHVSRFELKTRPSLQSTASSLSLASGISSVKTPHYEIFNLTQPDESSKDEPLKAKLCRLRKSKRYDGFGLVLKFQQHLHVIGEVEEASPSYRAGLRANDVIIFVGKTNVEKLLHDDVKVMIRAMTLASNNVELTVLSKLDIPRYKTFREKGLIDWSIMGLEI
jgi:C-terminal processing protease CtpA/Prc